MSHFPTRMRPSELQRAVIEAHRQVFSARAVAAELGRGSLVDAWEKATRRWMWSTIQRGLDEFLPWLERIEDGLYGRDGRLLEERLHARWTAGAEWRFPEADGASSGVGATGAAASFPTVNNTICRPIEPPEAPQRGTA